MLNNQLTSLNMSTRIVIFTFLIIVALCEARKISNDSDKVRRFHRVEGSRIIGGNEAELGQFPYHVSLRNEIGRFCGGAIISNRWALTSQDCVDGIDIDIDWLNIVTATHHSASGGYDYPVDRIVNHPDFIWTTLTNDISLLRTDLEIVFSDLVAAIPISNVHVGAGITAQVSSWGSTVVSVLVTFFWPHRLNFLFTVCLLS